MTALEIIAACVGVTVIATITIFVWRLASH